LGTFHPQGPFWGFNALAYFPLPIRIAVLCVALLLVVWAATKGIDKPGAASKTRNAAFNPWWEIAGGFLAFVVFYALPMKGLAYGDAKFMVDTYGNNQEFDPGWIKSVLHLNPFFSKEALSVLIHRTVAHAFSMSIQASYRLLGAVWGGLFVTGWLLFVR